nr:hypothetical protein GCM10010200_026640 [Actinomadura rugatobispora]
MGSIRRSLTPPGPITELFDRLNELHFRAGEPSVRQIARGIGEGTVSASTVYNALSGPRVPAWGFLELIVEQLGGNVTEYQPLWYAARRAEQAVQNRPPPRRAGRSHRHRSSRVRAPSGVRSRSVVLDRPGTRSGARTRPGRPRPARCTARPAVPDRREPRALGPGGASPQWALHGAPRGAGDVARPVAAAR